MAAQKIDVLAVNEIQFASHAAGISGAILSEGTVFISGGRLFVHDGTDIQRVAWTT